MFSVLIGLGLVLLQAEASQAVPPQGPASVAPQAAPSLPIPTPPAPGKTAHLAAGTQLEVEMVGPLSSATSRLGDKFALRLVTPISSDGVEVVAAGAMGEGEVIDASPSGMAGRAGKLILSARRLNVGGRPVRIHGLTLMGAGKSRVGLAAGFIQGGEVEIPAGARYTVKLAEDVDLPINPTQQAEGKAQ